MDHVESSHIPPYEMREKHYTVFPRTLGNRQIKP